MLAMLTSGKRDPVYTLTQNKTSVNEGAAVTFTLTTQNVPPATQLYWTINGSSSGGDFSDGAISGTFSHSGSTAIVRTLKADQLTEGLESFTLQIRKGSTTGPIVATSQTVVVNDTSIVPPTGQALFATVNGGTFFWTVPAGVTSICAVAVGGGGGGASGLTATSRRGGGGGGALSYVNNVAVTPGEVLAVHVGIGGYGGYQSAGGDGEDSYIQRGATYLVRAGGGAGGSADANTQAAGGISYNSGGAGGRGGGASNTTYSGGGGGGAGGYSPAGTVGTRGDGQHQRTTGTVNAQSGLNGGGGGGFGSTGTSEKYGTGGGVGVYGQGADGKAGSSTSQGGQGGSGGSTGSSTAGGVYGGGGAGQNASYTAQPGGQGAVRIIWGANRAFPSTNTGDL